MCVSWRVRFSHLLLNGRIFKIGYQGSLLLKGFLDTFEHSKTRTNEDILFSPNSIDSLKKP